MKNYSIYVPSDILNLAKEKGFEVENGWVTDTVTAEEIQGWLLEEHGIIICLLQLTAGKERRFKCNIDEYYLDGEEVWRYRSAGMTEQLYESPKTALLEGIKLALNEI